MSRVLKGSLTIGLVGFLSTAVCYAATDWEAPNEAEFAARLILSEWTKQISPSARSVREGCGGKCADGGAGIEMGIGLLGVGGERTTPEMLYLLSIKLDAAASEEMHCQFLNRGEQIVPHLRSLNAARTSSWCHDTFGEARKRELSEISDVPVQQVCSSPPEIREKRDELLSALKTGQGCEL